MEATALPTESQSLPPPKKKIIHCFSAEMKLENLLFVVILLASVLASKGQLEESTNPVQISSERPAPTITKVKKKKAKSESAVKGKNSSTHNVVTGLKVVYTKTRSDMPRKMPQNGVQ